MKTREDPTASVLPQALIDEYSRARPKSRQAFARAALSLPGGQTRSVTHYAPYPSVIVEGSGYTLTDIDGNEYIDVLNNYTSLVHGNAYRPVVEAVARVLDHGTAYASVHPTQIDLAEQIVERISSIELVRFTNSGSEAASLGARIAKHCTGRSEILVAEGGYHGAVPPFSDSDVDVKKVQYNDLSSLEATISERTAAVFLEPFQGAGGVIPADPEYLRNVQKVAHSHGSLFVLDEVQSLRNHPQGAQTEFSLEPDLTLLGKVIGGGFPIGAVGGKAELLEMTSPYASTPVSHAGTFNGHVASVVAGATTLENLDRRAISTLNQRSKRLALAIEKAGTEAGLDVALSRAGSIMNVYEGQLPQTAAEAARHAPFHAALHISLLLEGVYSAPRGMLNLSTVVTDDVIDELGIRYQSAFERLVSLAETT